MTFVRVITKLLILGGLVLSMSVFADYSDATDFQRTQMTLAREGNALAQYNLGKMYQNGYGVNQNDT